MVPDDWLWSVPVLSWAMLSLGMVRMPTIRGPAAGLLWIERKDQLRTLGVARLKERILALAEFAARLATEAGAGAIGGVPWSRAHGRRDRLPGWQAAPSGARSYWVNAGSTRPAGRGRSVSVRSCWTPASPTTA